MQYVWEQFVHSHSRMLIAMPVKSSHRIN